jgi:hypothetical protein
MELFQNVFFFAISGSRVYPEKAANTFWFSEKVIILTPKQRTVQAAKSALPFKAVHLTSTPQESSSGAGCALTWLVQVRTSWLCMSPFLTRADPFGIIM